MTVHANDVVGVIRDALEASTMVGSLSETKWTPNPDMDYQNRDGRIEFTGVGRDHIRGFRFVVEAIPLEEAFDALD